MLGLSACGGNAAEPGGWGAQPEEDKGKSKAFVLWKHHLPPCRALAVAVPAAPWRVLPTDAFWEHPRESVLSSEPKQSVSHAAAWFKICTAGLILLWRDPPAACAEHSPCSQHQIPAAGEGQEPLPWGALQFPVSQPGAASIPAGMLSLPPSPSLSLLAACAGGEQIRGC